MYPHYNSERVQYKNRFDIDLSFIKHFAKLSQFSVLEVPGYEVGDTLALYLIANKHTLNLFFIATADKRLYQLFFINPAISFILPDRSLIDRKLFLTQYKLLDKVRLTTWLDLCARQGKSLGLAPLVTRGKDVDVRKLRNYKVNRKLVRYPFEDSNIYESFVNGELKFE